MSHIVKYEIEGLAFRDDIVKGELDRHLNVFYGDNGSGKTTLLKIFHSALSGETDVLKDAPFRSATVDVYSRAHDVAYTRRFRRAEGVKTDVTGRSLKYFVLGSTGEITTQEAWWETTPTLPKDHGGTFFDVYLPINRLLAGGGAASAVWQRAKSLTDDQLNELFADQLQRLWIQYQGEIAGNIQRTQEEGIARILESVLSAPVASQGPASLKPETAFELVKSFINRQSAEYFRFTLPEKEFLRQYETNPQIQQVVKHLEDIENSVASATAPQRSLQSLLSEMFSRKSVTFDERSLSVKSTKQEAIPLAALSSGEKQLLLIFISALSTSSSSLIVDEPELSMHVDWQRKLVSSLRLLNPEMQLIAATHSPEIAADAPDVTLRPL